MFIETSTGKHIHLIATENDLKNPKSQGQWTRALCPIHGGDHQRSLSIHKTSGWGSCFQCHAVVLLEEYNPQTAQDLRQKYEKRDTAHQRTKNIGHHPYRPSNHHSERGKYASSKNKHEEQKTGEPWQQAEVQALRLLHPWMQQALNSIEIGDGWQAQAYLAGRAIPLDIALQEGVGYLPRELLFSHPEFQRFQRLLNRWTERIIFPLRSPNGNGYIGRSIWGWQVGMNEDEHKGLLTDEKDAPYRYIKTNPAGWFCAPPIDWSDCVALVEGPFDRLALIAAGMKSANVHALVGTAFDMYWIPEHIVALILALDGDQTGIEAMERIAEMLRATTERMLVEIAFPPTHNNAGQECSGKDWSSRWMRYGYSGVSTLTETFQHISDFFQPF